MTTNHLEYDTFNVPVTGGSSRSNGAAFVVPNVTVVPYCFAPSSVDGDDGDDVDDVNECVVVVGRREKFSCCAKGNGRTRVKTPMMILLDVDG